jgi:hypothetical protein
MEAWKEIEGYNGIYLSAQEKVTDHYCEGDQVSGNKQVDRELNYLHAVKGHIFRALVCLTKRFNTGVHRLM